MRASSSRCRAARRSATGCSLLSDFDRLLEAALYGPVVLAMLLETLAPCRAAFSVTGRRWFRFGCLWFIDTMLARAADFRGRGSRPQRLGVAACAAAPGARRIRRGLPADRSHGPPEAARLAAVPVLWHLQVVHHSHVDIDVANGMRHHPADYLLGSCQASCRISLSIQASLFAAPCSLV